LWKEGHEKKTSVKKNAKDWEKRWGVKEKTNLSDIEKGKDTICKCVGREIVTV